MNPQDKITDVAIDTASALANSVYEDVARPAARRVGSALDTLFKIGLSPVVLLDWGFEQTKVWLTDRLRERISSTPTEFQQLPPSQLAIPLILAIATAVDSEDLRSLYAELLMKAMDSRTVTSVHPSYVSVLGQLTPQEALVVMSFRAQRSSSLFVDKPRNWQRDQDTVEALFHRHCVGLGLEDPISDVWLQNLLRLRLFELNTYTDARYRAADYDDPQPRVETYEERHLSVTDYGQAFIAACAPSEHDAT